MRLKKIYTLYAGIVLLFACAAPNQLSPQETVKAFIAAMQHRDYTAAKKLCTTESNSLIEAVASSGNNLFPLTEKDTFRITSVTNSNDSCFITLLIPGKTYPMKMLLLNRHGWKVAYSLQAILEVND